MEKYESEYYKTFEMDCLLNQDDNLMSDRNSMGRRVCDNCGNEKDTSGGKTCSNGHFICHSCASRHVHCPLCGHTLR